MPVTDSEENQIIVQEIQDTVNQIKILLLQCIFFFFFESMKENETRKRHFLCMTSHIFVWLECSFS